MNIVELLKIKQNEYLSQNRNVDTIWIEILSKLDKILNIDVESGDVNVIFFGERMFILTIEISMMNNWLNQDITDKFNESGDEIVDRIRSLGMPIDVPEIELCVDKITIRAEIIMGDL